MVKISEKKNLTSKEINFWKKEFENAKNIKFNDDDIDGRQSIFYSELTEN